MASTLNTQTWENQTELDLRTRALDLALQAYGEVYGVDSTPVGIVKRAEAYLAFMKGGIAAPPLANPLSRALGRPRRKAKRRGK